MNKQRRAGIAAIVGRANTGKSSLFNAVLGIREAIVSDTPGTTRDSLTARVEQSGKHFWLVDTAGMKIAEDDFEMTIQAQIEMAVDSADVILVVIEAHNQLSEEDRRVANMALKSKKPVVLVVNKADKVKNPLMNDYQKLGIKPIFLTSATQKTGIKELLASVAELMPQKEIQVSPNTIRVGLIGRPNVGKSSLLNTLVKKQKAIVSPRAGTTRDINREMLRYKGTALELMDTAGIRRSGKIERGIEYFSVLRSLLAIEQSDICFLLIDVNELGTHLDQKIAGMIKDAGKGLIIVVSKWDSIEKTPYTRDEIAPQLIDEFNFAPWAPLIFTSAVTGQNVSKLFDLILEIKSNRQQTYQTAELNKWLRNVTESHPPAGLKNRQPRLNYMVHEEGNPIPSFKIFGSATKYLHWSYKRYMEREFRQQWPLIGTPLKFWFIEKSEK